jgi:hypothetical protein
MRGTKLFPQTVQGVGARSVGVGGVVVIACEL